MMMVTGFVILGRILCIFRMQRDYMSSENDPYISFKYSNMNPK